MTIPDFEGFSANAASFWPIDTESPLYSIVVNCRSFSELVSEGQQLIVPPPLLLKPIDIKSLSQHASYQVER